MNKVNSYEAAAKLHCFQDIWLNEFAVNYPACPPTDPLVVVVLFAPDNRVSSDCLGCDSHKELPHCRMMMMMMTACLSGHRLSNHYSNYIGVPERAPGKISHSDLYVCLPIINISENA